MARRNENQDLTALEAAYVRELTRTDDGKPSSQSEAYRRVYKPQGKPSTVATEASRVAKRPQVRREIARITRIQDLERVRKRSATIGKIEASLWSIYSDPGSPAAARVNALKELRQITDPKGEGDLATLCNAYTKQELINEIVSRFQATLGDALVDVTDTGSDISDDWSDDGPSDILDIEVVGESDPVVD